MPSQTPMDISSSDPSITSTSKRGTPGVRQTPYTPSMRIPHTPKVLQLLTKLLCCESETRFLHIYAFFFVYIPMLNIVEFSFEKKSRYL